MPTHARHVLRWVGGVWAVAAAFVVVTALWSHQVDIPLRDPAGKMFRGRLTSALVLFAILAAVDVLLRSGRDGWSVRGAVRVLRERCSPQRLALVVSGLLAYHVVYVCYRNLKSWDAFNTLRDDHLVDLERWVFLGNSPAALLHDLLGQHTAAYVLMVVYKSFTYLVPLSLVAALAFTDRIRDGYVFLTSAIWVWILGVGSYYLIPTLGPFAASPQDFAQLPDTVITSTQTEYLAERAHLLQDPSAGDAFASLSAFASLHVAFTCMVLLMLRHYGRRRLAWLMTAYLAATVLATVYFGWHYVVDDVAGVLIAVLAVFLGRRMILPGGRRETS